MFLRSFISILVLKISLFSCADYWDPSRVEFLFLDSKDSVFLQYSEDLNDPAIYNEIIYKYEDKNKEANLKEWESALKNKYSKDDIEKFIYKRENLNSLRDSELLEYIKFAQEQESCATYSYFEDRPTNCKEYIPKALQKLESAKSDFLKQRYFYLAFRLAHFNKENPLDIYKKYSYLTSNSNSIVKDWVQGLYSGALVKSGKKVEGIYEFTKLFDSSINSHLALYNFFHIKSQEEFNSLINLAKSNDEKAKMYTLRALDSSSNTIEEMKSIYELDKNSKWLDFLLYRELLKSQTIFNSDDYTYFDEDTKKVDNTFFKKYEEFLSGLKKENNYLVDLSLIYFNIYLKEYDKAKNISDNLLKSNPNSHEVQTASYILFLNSLSKIDSKVEDEIFSRIDKLIDKEHSSNAIFEYTLQVLAKLYKDQGLDFDKFLAQNSLFIDYTNLDLENFRKFEEFLQKPQESKLKTYLQSKFKDMLGKSGNYENSSFKFAKVTTLINNLLFEEALKTNFDTLNQKLEFNPFNGLIRGNNRSGKKESISIKEFLEKTIVIQKELERDPSSAMDNFLFANVLYNLSYFGNSSNITTTYRSVAIVHTPKLQEEKLTSAIKHYEIALNNAKDSELKAKITYQLAKTKLALFDLKYDSYPQSSSYYYNKSQKYYYGMNDDFYEAFLKDSGSKYFDKLRSDFSNTKYYKELLKECGDFKTYINSKK